MTTSTVWTLAGSPYFVTSRIDIHNGATLTIQAGVVVRLAMSQGIHVGAPGTASPQGTLVAQGTVGSPVLFTDAAQIPGGICSGICPFPCFATWDSIHFTDEAVDAIFSPNGSYVSGSILESCVVDRGGSTFYPPVRIERSAPYLYRCTVQNSCPYGGVRAQLLPGSTPTPLLRIHECKIRNNTSSNAGGGIAVLNGPVRISSSTIENNTTNTGGAGLYLSNCPSSAIEGNRIIGNQGYILSSQTESGGLKIEDCDDLVVADNLISGNRASGFGGCFFWSSENLLLTRNSIVGNVATSGSAAAFGYGGVFLASSSNATISYNIIANNSSMRSNAGLSAYSPGVVVVGNTIANNQAQLDIGGLQVGSATSALVMDNWVNGNSASGRAGGIQAGIASLLSGNSIVCNTAADGGGVFVTIGAVGVSLAGSAAGGSGNVLLANTAISRGSEIFCDLRSVQAPVLPAQDVCWGGLVPSTQSSIFIWDSSDDPTLATVQTSPTTPCSRFASLGGGVGHVNANGVPVVPLLSGSGSLAGGTTVTLTLTMGAPIAAGYLVIAGGTSYIPVLGGLAIPALNQLVLPFQTDSSGTYSLGIVLPTGIQSGTKFFVQAVVSDATTVNGIASISTGLLCVTP